MGVQGGLMSIEANLKKCLTFVLTGLIVWPLTAWSLPHQFGQAGHVVDARGRPINGTVNIRVRLYDSPVRGSVR